jgi:hypothetical protein
VVAYKLFGVNPLGYYLTIAVLLIMMTCLLYLDLSLLDQPRFLAAAVPLLYISLPNYSTNCLWFSGSIGIVSVTFCLLDMYGLLRAAQRHGKSALAWAALSVVALLLSGLTYEITIPLFAVNLLLTIWWTNHKASIKDSISSNVGLRTGVIGNVAALALLIIFKIETTVRFHAESLSLSWVRYVISGAVRVHFIDYGIRLPWVVFRAVRLDPDWKNFVLAAIFGLAILLYAKRTSDSERAGTAAALDVLKLIGCGLVSFVAGNAIFILSPREVGFTNTGILNRINTSASLGVAIMFVGGIRLLGSLVRVGWRGVIEGSLLALFCTTGIVINNTVASFWTMAHDEQTRILADIVEHNPSIPHATTLILDGVCPYIGPGIAFECFWDFGSASKVIYHDWTLTGDVVTPRLKIEQQGL